MIYFIAILLILITVTIYYYNSLITAEQKVYDAREELLATTKDSLNIIKNIINLTTNYESFTKIKELYNTMNSEAPLNTKIKTISNISLELSKNNPDEDIYPELKTNNKYFELVNDLTNSENRILDSRIKYNSAKANLSIKIKSFPTNIIAKIFKINIPYII